MISLETFSNYTKMTNNYFRSFGNFSIISFNSSSFTILPSWYFSSNKPIVILSKTSTPKNPNIVEITLLLPAPPLAPGDAEITIHFLPFKKSRSWIEHQSNMFLKNGVGLPLYSGVEIINLSKRIVDFLISKN